MAKKPSTTRTLDSDVARELEKALDIDLSGDIGDGDLDIAASMEDLEAQISQAADELAREGRGQMQASAFAQGQPLQGQTTQSQATQSQAVKSSPNAKPAELRPVEREFPECFVTAAAGLFRHSFTR